MKLITRDTTNRHKSGDTNHGQRIDREAIFADPVRYLAGLGIDSQLISVTHVRVPEAA